jgi:electron transfer flavoprotein beta subunit
MAVSFLSAIISEEAVGLTIVPPRNQKSGINPMKIVVAIKQVPVRDSQLRIDANQHWIQEDDLGFEINEPDAYALEEALQLKEKHGGEVVALCAGPARAAQTIREALAKGADRAIHIEDETLRQLDTLGIAHLLAGAVKTEKPDLILTGLQSDDLGYGQTGVVLAELLGVPHSTIIMQVEVSEGSIRVKRELEGGWFQHIEMPLPAVLTIQSGINKLRYATLMGIKKAKTKEIRRVTPSELGSPPAAVATLERVYVPQKSKQTQIFEGDAKTVAAQLVEKLKFEVRVL